MKRYFVEIDLTEDMLVTNDSMVDLFAKQKL